MKALALNYDLLLALNEWPQGSRRAWALELLRDAPDPISEYDSLSEEEEEEEEEQIWGGLYKDYGSLSGLVCSVMAVNLLNNS